MALPLFDKSFYPDFAEELQGICFRYADEFLQLQQQIISCINAERDTEKLNKDIMPGIIKGSGFKITPNGIEEKPDDPMEDILDPDAADNRMTDTEKYIQKMYDMQKNGSDIYFSGFKTMKRYAFFYTLSNWFTPFYIQHPGLPNADREVLKKPLFLNLFANGPFCDSDKYSFALTANHIFNMIPKDLYEMVNMPGNQFANQEEFTSKPIHLRQMYLQDLYRFFKLHPQRNDLPYDPFKTDPYGTGNNYFVLDHEIFNDIDDVQILLMRARYHNKNHRYSLSTSELYALVEKYPDNVQARAMLAHALLELGSYTKAADQYEQLLTFKPGHFKYQLNHALSLTKASHYSDAMDELFQLNYEHPDEPQVKRILAWVLLMQKRDEQALRYYEDLIESKKVLESDKLNAAFCYWFMGNIKRAVELFRQYTRTNHTSLEVAFIEDEELLKIHEVSDFDRQLIMELVVRQ